MKSKNNNDKSSNLMQLFNLQHNPMQIYSDISTITFSGAYSQESLGGNLNHIYLEVNTTELIYIYIQYLLESNAYLFQPKLKLKTGV